MRGFGAGFKDGDFGGGVPIKDAHRVLSFILHSRVSNVKMTHIRAQVSRFRKIAKKFQKIFENNFSILDFAEICLLPKSTSPATVNCRVKG